jgi:MFS family permease
VTGRLRTFRGVMRDPDLRAVALAYLGFNMTEFATWIAILVFAFDRGSAAEAGVASLILLVPSAVAGPFAAYAGDRFRRDRVLLVTNLLQAIALGGTAIALFVDTPGPSSTARRRSRRSRSPSRDRRRTPSSPP